MSEPRNFFIANSGFLKIIVKKCGFEDGLINVIAVVVTKDEFTFGVMNSSTY